MNIDTVAGEGTVAKGGFKETLANIAGDHLLQRDGLADRMSGTLRQAFGGVRDFVRKQPAAAALVATGVAALFLRRSRGNRAR